MPIRKSRKLKTVKKVKRKLVPQKERKTQPKTISSELEKVFKKYGKDDVEPKLVKKITDIEFTTVDDIEKEFRKLQKNRHKLREYIENEKDKIIFGIKINEREGYAIIDSSVFINHFEDIGLGEVGPRFFITNLDKSHHKFQDDFEDWFDKKHKGDENTYRKGDRNDRGIGEKVYFSPNLNKLVDEMKEYMKVRGYEYFRI